MIRVDSRYRSSGDFTVRLPRTVQFLPGTEGFVTAVSLPHVWFNVDATVSDKLHVIETRSTNRRCRVVQLDAGNHTSVTWQAANWMGTADPIDVRDLDTMGDLLRLPAAVVPPPRSRPDCST